MIPIARPSIGEEEIKAVTHVLKSGMIAQGPKVREFEQRFADFIGVKNAVAVNSGTAALHCSLYATGIKQGDEVITAPFTFVATANTIMMQGAKPIFVDVEEETFNIDANKLEEKITKKTKAILPVDLYGHPYNFDSVKKIAKKYNLLIVEDACQAIGSEHKGRKCGTLGNISAFSFYATKNITTGEGGMIATDNNQFAELAKRFRHHGQSQSRYEYQDLGYNYRMTDICAAIGIEQLKKLQKMNAMRIKNAEYLSKGLRKIDGIATPAVKKGCKHVFHQYTIKVEEDFKLKRDELLQYLNKKGVNCVIYYPNPLHLCHHIAKLGYKKNDFPAAEKLSQQVISLPVHPHLTKEELKYIISVFEEI